MPRKPIAVLSVLVLAAGPTPAEETRASPEGPRVRIHAGKATAIPGVVSIRSGDVSSKGPVVQNDGRLVAVKMPEWSEPVCLPRPKATVTGRLVSVDDAALTILVDGQASPYRVPRDLVEAIDVSTGHIRRGDLVLKHGGIGLIAGATAGSLLMFAATSNCSSDCGLLTTNQYIALGAVGGAAWGLVIGALVGTGKSTDRWEPVTTDRLKVSVGPNRRGAGVSVALAFR